MARKSRAAVPARRRQRGRQAAVPRPLAQSTCVVRRAYSAGNLAYPGAIDGGFQFGITPTAVLDWSAFASVWQRFRVLSATMHFVLWGQNDSTPTYPLIYIFHDTMSTGAPATLLDALVRKGRRLLPFSASRTLQSFKFQPLPWTSNHVNMTMARPTQAWLPTNASPAAMTSAAAWIQSYNNTSQAPGLNLNIELVLEFDAPQ